MAQPDTTNSKTRAAAARGRRNISVSVTPETADRLEQLTEGVPGMQRGRLAGELLDELVPTVTGVKRRLQIMRAPRSE